MEKKQFDYVKVKKIHPSSVLPARSHGDEIAKSVKVFGVQQSLVIRPHPTIQGEYEIIDGRGRHESLDPEEEVLVEIRENVSDAHVFRISEATSKRTQRSAYENAEFFKAYVDAVKKEVGEKGALSRVAKEAIIGESLLSQYLSINELFFKLSQLDPESEFRKLKSLGINKLYTLASLKDHEKLLEVANEIEEKADSLTVEGVDEIVNKVKNADTDEIMKMLEANDTTGPHPTAQEYVPESQAYSKDLSEKVAKMLKDLNSFMQQIQPETLVKPESASPENRNILEKLSVNLRRLLFYLRKLQKKQKTVAGESSK